MLAKKIPQLIVAPIALGLVLLASTASAQYGSLHLSISGTGMGTIQFSTEGNPQTCPPTCGVSCSPPYSCSTTLVAIPSPGSTFSSWGGHCSSCGTSPSCGVNYGNQDIACIARFDLAVTWYTISVTAQGSGSGTVTSTPAGVNLSYPASSSAASSFEGGSTVVLSAQAGPHSTASWSSCPGGAVSGNGSGLATCTFSSLDGDKNALLSFDLENYEVSVSVLPPGGGTVTSDPPGIDCPENCTAPYPYGTEVSLKALPSAGYVFLGWEGCDGATEDQCSVTVTGPKGVTARFQEGFSLKVIRSPSGGGEVIMNPPGGTYLPGTEVILTAVASHGFVFRGWQWDAQGISPSISVLMDRDKDIIAQFVSTDTVEKSAALPGGGPWKIT